MCLWFLFVFFFKRSWNDSVFADKASGLLNSRTDCLLLYLHDFFFNVISLSDSIDFPVTS